MKIKIIESNNLQKLEIIVNNFCEGLKIDDMKLIVTGYNFIMVVCYYDIV